MKELERNLRLSDMIGVARTRRRRRRRCARSVSKILSWERRSRALLAVTGSMKNASSVGWKAVGRAPCVGHRFDVRRK
ncbi:hypothetical protein QJS04_geneDACA020130 [Acorus gramineus]|uniref:Uncharacterized protein n=1 Tax=Acorus gramineus TaxID=55184 RepID=A0AAV9BMN0_ACOGR|nr:hypothetical protein QJS04_geneDACA020130 [Acorus gramineus]